MLMIKNLCVKVKKKKILENFSLHVNSGEVHAIMGPNGSGKSTFVETLAGNKNFFVEKGEILFRKKNLLSLRTEERAGEGIFITFQNPIEIPGVNNKNFLKTSLNSIRKYRKQKLLDTLEFENLIQKKIVSLGISKDFLNRYFNVGFSGGEKKKNEILQMAILDPILSVLDEIDSGLDIDALKTVANSINHLQNAQKSLIIITHYPRILKYIRPNFVHILNKKKIVASEDFSIIKKIEEQGYEYFKGK
ncbi:Fe-S cluster assembly ATPase SufC [bacterium endosymbiont of Pedicinus badii]|uniref:Fe-S cluster assembly ATPase SufC n=1 Tax=bacterium endosymbiont of Pedicinus badii TaxID=1719126 RepID=UPI0009BB6DBA|nr:Fe-S cluster assembly ATPase SufC [bacterium endosymbiont of Pedicinus badii]OQM34391.1 cysteine desulfurase [bacterium endosymbiont of Pedicinus badii]